MRVINVAAAQMGLNDPTPDRCRYADHALSADKHGGSRVSLLAVVPVTQGQGHRAPRHREIDIS